MFTLFDLQDLCADEEKLRAFLLKYGVLAGGNVCSCGQPLGENWLMDHGSSYRRCMGKTCRRRLFAKADGILEGSHLSLKQWARVRFRAWGNLKNFLRARGGCASAHLESSVKEFQWRRNLPKGSDPFISLLLCAKDGCFQ